MYVNTKDFKITVPALLFDPAYHLFDFVADKGMSKFLVAEEAMIEQSPFIDIRFEPLAQAQFWVSTSELFSLEGSHEIPRHQPVFIFHHAFVCSTLLARCLNQADAFFSLKEPWILRRMADHKRANPHLASSPAWQELFRKYVMLLCKNYRTGRIPVIKATNVANNLMADVLRFLPGRKILYLYSDLESFLVSNLKKTGDTQQKIPALVNGFLRDSDFAKRFPQMSTLPGMTFLQVCAVNWLVNLYNFKKLVELHGGDQVRTLDAQDLLNDLPSTLSLLGGFFGHSPGPSELQRMTDPKVTGTNAKDQSRPYGKEHRQLETNQIKSRHEKELSGAIAWIAPLAGELGVLEFMHAHRLAG